MPVSKEEAIAKVDEVINAMDLDWPTKPKHVVFDELTVEREDGWLFYYGIPDDMRVHGRDPEPADNPPWLVKRESGDMELVEGE